MVFVRGCVDFFGDSCADDGMRTTTTTRRRRKMMRLDNIERVVVALPAACAKPTRARRAPFVVGSQHRPGRCDERIRTTMTERRGETQRTAGGARTNEENGTDRRSASRAGPPMSAAAVVRRRPTPRRATRITTSVTTIKTTTERERSLSGRARGSRGHGRGMKGPRAARGGEWVGARSIDRQ